MAKLITHASDDCIELLHKLLAYNPEDRVSARQAMRHPYLKELREMEKKVMIMVVMMMMMAIVS